MVERKIAIASASCHCVTNPLAKVIAVRTLNVMTNTAHRDKGRRPSIRALRMVGLGATCYAAAQLGKRLLGTAPRSHSTDFSEDSLPRPEEWIRSADDAGLPADHVAVMRRWADEHAASREATQVA
jgi:hypothetical protein